MKSEEYWKRRAEEIFSIHCPEDITVGCDGFTRRQQLLKARPIKESEKGDRIKMDPRHTGTP